MSSEQHPLLEIQHLDTLVGQLRHQHASLPERAELAAADDELTSLGARRHELEARTHELEREQKRLEDELALLEERIAATERALSGTTSPKEAQSINEELGGQNARKDHLEDGVLEVLDALDPLVAEITSLDERAAEVQSRRADAEARLADSEGAVDAELTVALDERSAVAGRLDADELATYEERHAMFGSSAVVTFEGSRCVGCPLAMPAVEVDRVKKAPEGSVLTCEECGRLVLR